MLLTGLLFALLSGICNGLFSAPMKMIPRWRWENIWFVFIVTACLVMPVCFAAPAIPRWSDLWLQTPSFALAAAIGFGFAWGFGAICFGLSVDRLGVSIANSLVIGLSSAFGSLVPLLTSGALRFDARQNTLFAGILAFLIGVVFCARAGLLRDGSRPSKASFSGYLLAIGSGIMSAVFNIGYSLALPIAATGTSLGLSQFTATNCIWVLMLAAGAIPNLVYCGLLMKRHTTGRLLAAPRSTRAWSLNIAMGLLWGGSIFLYGAATPRLGDIGPSIGWPLSLAVGLLVANVMGILLHEWRNASAAATRRMKLGIVILVAAILLCAFSTRIGP
jgi:L-rhamnose-H+ transport protein